MANSQTLKYRFVEQGLSRLKKKVSGLGDEFKDVGGAASDASNELGDVSEQAEETESSFGGLVTGGGSVASKISKIAGISATAASGIAAVGTAAVVAAGKLSQLTIEASRYAETIDRINQQSGIASDKIQEVYFQASRLDSKVDLDTVRDSFKELALRSAEAAEGTGEAEEAFERLGITKKELKLKDTAEVFELVRKRMGRLSQQERVLTAEQVFGGEGGQRFIELMNLSAKETKQLKEEVQGLGLSAEELDSLNSIAEETNSITQEWQALKRELGADWASILDPILQGVDNVLRKTRKLVDEINGIEWFIGAVTGNFNTFDNVETPSMGEQESVEIIPQHYIEDQIVEDKIIEQYENINPQLPLNLEWDEAMSRANDSDFEAAAAGLTNPGGDTSNLQGILPDEKAKERIRQLKLQLQPLKIAMKEMGRIGETALGNLSQGFGQVVAQVLTLDKSISSLGDVFKKMKNVVVQVLQQIITKLASAAIFAAILAPLTGGGSFGSIFTGFLTGGAQGGFGAATQGVSGAGAKGPGAVTMNVNVQGESRIEGQDIVTSYGTTKKNQRRKGRTS